MPGEDRGENRLRIHSGPRALAPGPSGWNCVAFIIFSVVALPDRRKMPSGVVTDIGTAGSRAVADCRRIINVVALRNTRFVFGLDNQEWLFISLLEHA